jgi:hypothetical protein
MELFDRVCHGPGGSAPSVWRAVVWCSVFPQFLDSRICVLPGCGQPLPAGVRTETLYCSKRCRQAASRRRLKDRPSAATPAPAERCAWCQNPVPLGLRPEARYCSKRCRQASSRFAIAVRQGVASTALGPRRHVALCGRCKHWVLGSSEQQVRRRGDAMLRDDPLATGDTLELDNGRARCRGTLVMAQICR